MARDVKAEKAALRAEMLAKRNAMTADEVAAKSAAITAEVLALRTYQEASTVCGYMAIGNEVRTREILLDALAAGKTVLLPRVQKNPKRLSLHAVTSLDDLVPGPYGILEPGGDVPEHELTTGDFCFVPGLAYDTLGYRLGYGGGFYDRLIEPAEKLSVGFYALSFLQQLVSVVPTQANDQVIDYIVTEAGMIDCHSTFDSEDSLRLRNMTFYGYHGVNESEREQGIRFAVDVQMTFDLQHPGLTDDITATVNYPAVYRFIDELQKSRQFHLFEALAEAIARGILREFSLVRRLTVAVRKFNPPVGGVMDAFEVEITRYRSWQHRV